MIMTKETSEINTGKQELQKNVEAGKIKVNIERTEKHQERNG